MTIKHLHFAVKPHECDVCGRAFVLEPYNIITNGAYTPLGAVITTQELICRRCERRKEAEETDA